MGEVYRATDTKLGREVALKILPAELAADPIRLQRFQREARTVAALNHPHIVTLYSVEEAEGIPFLTMELAEGDNLQEALAEGKPSPDEVAAIGIAVGQALAAAHAKGVVHRDLKPANIVVNDAGGVKVLDFGMAKLTDPTGIRSQSGHPRCSPDHGRRRSWERCPTWPPSRPAAKRPIIAPTSGPSASSSTR